MFSGEIFMFQRKVKKLLAALLSLTLMSGSFMPCYASEADARYVEDRDAYGDFENILFSEDFTIPDDIAASESMTDDDEKLISESSEMYDSEAYTETGSGEEKGISDHSEAMSAEYEELYINGLTWIKPASDWYKDYDLEIDEDKKEIYLTKAHSNLSGKIIVPGTLSVDGTDYTIVIKRGNSSFSSIWSDCTNLDGIRLDEGVRVYNNDCSNMFSGCTSLMYIDLSSFDSSEVTNMRNMFSGCTALYNVILDNFNTSNVTNMQGMFDSCTSLYHPDVGSFDTSKVKDMSCMFRSSGVMNLDLSKWKTSSVKDLSNMFECCFRLQTVNMSGWDTSNVISMYDVFHFCSELQAVNLEGWNTPKVTGMTCMFTGCVMLKELDLSGWDTRSLTEMYWIFAGCESLEKLSLKGWDLSNIETYVGAFDGCVSLKRIETPKKIVKDMSLPVSLYDTKTKKDFNTLCAECADSLLLSEQGKEEESDRWIIEEVKKYTSDYDAQRYSWIVRSDKFTMDEKLRLLMHYFNFNNLTDLKEGISYLSEVSSYYRNYLYLTTDENFCATNYYDWIFSSEAFLARFALVEDSLLFAGECWDYVDPTKYITQDMPGVKKNKEILKKVMNAALDEEENGVLKNIDSVKKETKTVSGYLKKVEKINGIIETDTLNKLDKNLDNAIKGNNQAQIDKASKELVDYICKTDSSLEKKTVNGKTVCSMKVPGASFSDAVGKSTQVVEIGVTCYDDFKAFMELEKNLETYKKNARFLKTVSESRYVGADMRYAADLLLTEIETGWYTPIVKTVTDAYNLVVSDDAISLVAKSAGCTGFADVFGGAKSYITLSVFMSNLILDAGDFSKQVWYTCSFAELGKAYSEQLEKDKQDFLKNQTEDNAWKFFEDYTMLWQIRKMGEEQYLEISKVKILTVKTEIGNYTLRNEAVQSILDFLETCKFHLPEYVKVPEAASYAKKAVFNCPVDVYVYTKSGEQVAVLRDGAESDVTNSYGRFAVIYDPFTGEYTKVICQNNGADLNYKAVAVGDGVVDYQTFDGKDIKSFDKVAIGVDDVITVNDQKYVLTKENGQTQEGKLDTKKEDSYIAVTGITVPVETIALSRGQTKFISCTVTPSNAEDTLVNWKSMNKDIASVDKGSITGITSGETDIVVCSMSNPSVSKTVHVVVNGHAPLNPVPEITEDTAAIHLVKGQKFNLPGTDWTCSDKSYVNINKKGLLTAKKVTQSPVVISAKERNVEVYITQPRMTLKSISMEAGACSRVPLEYDSANLSALWLSSAPDIATVTQDGTVSAVSKGSATVTAYINGTAYKCTVKVKETKSALQRTLHMTKNSTKSISIKDVKKPVWNADHSDMVSINGNKIKALKTGETVLRTTYNGKEYVVYLYVEDPVINDAAFTSKGKNVYELNMTAGTQAEVPFATLYQDVVLISNKGNVAFYDDGRITAISEGKAKFSAKINGSAVTVNVTVSSAKGE